MKNKSMIKSKDIQILRASLNEAIDKNAKLSLYMSLINHSEAVLEDYLKYAIFLRDIDVSKSLKILDNAQVKFGENVWIEDNRARAFVVLKKFPEALNCWNKALLILPKESFGNDIFTNELKALNELIAEQSKEKIVYSLADLFDEYYYIESTKSSAIITNPIEHYLTIGWKKSISPTPYFDFNWYLAAYKESNSTTVDPLSYFIEKGIEKLHNPHPLFNAKWYQETYLSENKINTPPLIHYTTEGWKQNAKPHPLFWSDWYTKTYLKDLAEPIDPFYHFIVWGWRNGFNPNPLFDVKFYQQQHKNEVIGPDPLSHYCYVGWAKGISPHPLFNTKYYLANEGLELTSLKLSPLQHFFENKEMVSPHPLFDAEFYLEQIAPRTLDVPALVDYLAQAWDAKTDPHPFFSKAHYYTYAADVALSEMEALLHYAQSGYSENRAVHPLFDHNFYVAEHQLNLQTTNPLAHYLTIGYHKGSACRNNEAPDQNLKPFPSSRKTITLPTHLKINPDASQHGKVGVFAHIFYPDLAQEMLEKTKNIPSPCCIYISTDTSLKAKEIKAICEEHSIHPFEIRVTPNRGRDIAPMIVGFRDRLKEVDFGIHIHSKKSKHYAKEFNDWRTYLFEANLGTPELVSNILSLLENEKIGAYIPEHFGAIKKLIQWGGNFGMVSGLLGLHNQKVFKESVLDFPSGSMFWFKASALQVLLKTNLRYYHFNPEAGQIDGTLAHAIERSFLYFVEMAGYEWLVGLPATNKKVESIENQELLNNLLAQGNRYLPASHELGTLRHYYPECSKFFVRPSFKTKPRINLLIPTVETSQGYAGVATALDMFFAIREQLGEAFDARLISTDATPSNQYAPPSNYQFIAPLDADVADEDVVIDGAQRYRYPFFVRENDIFMATAWWTAQNALDIMRQQQQIFAGREYPFLYLIQDYECGFYAWSTKYALADQTYRHPEKTIPIFNTEILFNFFKAHNYYQEGFTLYPGINVKYKEAICRDTKKERIVLLYARSHAERNCLPFLDVIISSAAQNNPDFWADWRFIAIGENFNAEKIKISKSIEILGRLTLDEYAELASKSALAISLMVSPHPSYPPLEMAEAGVLVLANNYDNKDLSLTHDNIETFSAFDVDAVSEQLFSLANKWNEDSEIGWRGKAKIDWFFGGKSNLDEVSVTIAEQLLNFI